jgi:hypothetical protein
VDVISPARNLSRRIFQGIRTDASGLFAALAPLDQPEIGLHYYDIDLPGGRSMRMHLRIEPDGSGILFVDVTDVVHLNPTAAIMTKMALERVPIGQARVKIFSSYWGIDAKQLDDELTKIYQMVDEFRNPTGECPTCLLNGSIEVSPLFSLGVNAPYKVDVALTWWCFMTISRACH